MWPLVAMAFLLWKICFFNPNLVEILKVLSWNFEYMWPSGANREFQGSEPRDNLGANFKFFHKKMIVKFNLDLFLLNILIQK